MIGLADKVVPPSSSRDLAALFNDPVVYEHDQAHCLPTRAADMRALLDFIQGCIESVAEEAASLEGGGAGQKIEPSSQSVPDEAHKEAQEEEMEALEAIYADELQLEEGDVQGGLRHFSVALDGSALLEGQGATIRLGVKFTPSYPDEPPIFSLLHELSSLQLPSRGTAAVVGAAREACCDFLGTAGVFSAITAANECLLSAAWSEVEDTQATKEVPPPDLPDCEDVNAAVAQATCDVDAALGELDDKGSTAAAAAQRGAWRFVVGLVGKPRLVAQPRPAPVVAPSSEAKDFELAHLTCHSSAGKSTLFNCITQSSDAKVAAHPFTTISPNIGPGWWAVEEAGGQRVLELQVKDVAGLVPGAYEGRGKGNAFLNDLCEADVLIHVVDASGRSDRNGNVLEGEEGNPADDVRWVREELHQWIYGNVMRKWDGIIRRPSKLPGMFSGYRAAKALVLKAIALGGMNPMSEPQYAKAHWTEEALHRVVAAFMRLRFPILLALNKIDREGSEAKIDHVRETMGGNADAAVPISAGAEAWLQQGLKAGRLNYKLGEGSYQDMNKGELPAKGQKAWLAGQAMADEVLSRFGSTGILEAVSAAVQLRPPVLVYPVADLETCAPLGDPKGPRLADCLALKPGSTVEDLFDCLKHGSFCNEKKLSGELVRVEGMTLDGSQRRPLTRDTVITADCCVIKLMTNKKTAWQRAG
ncbi:unnamed protein product [Chrysoparadoxa australica]